MLIGSDIMRISVRDMVYVVFRHKWKAVVLLVLVVIGATGYGYLGPEVFRSDAALLIRLGRETMELDPSVSGRLAPVLATREGEVKSEIAILKSRALVEQTVDAMGEAAFDKARGPAPKTLVARLKRVAKTGVNAVVAAANRTLETLDLRPSLTPRERIVKKLMKGLGVEVETDTSILSVTLDTPSPELAQTALDHLVRFYLERHIEVHSAQASPEFFEKQAERMREELALREQEMAKFREEHGVVNLQGQQDKLLDQTARLESQLNEAAAMVSGSKARLTTLDKAMSELSKTMELSRTTGRTNYAADAYKDKLADLRLGEADLSARFADTYRPLVELREKIEQLEATLAEEEETHTEVVTGLNQNYQEFQLAVATERAQLVDYQAREKTLAGKLNQVKKQIALLTEFNELTRDIELAEKEYREYRDSLQRSRISAALDIDKVSNVSVVQAATLPIDAIRPRKLLSIGLGIAVGLFGGLSLAFLCEYLNDSLNTKEKAEKMLGFPVLAVVSNKEFRQCT